MFCWNSRTQCPDPPWNLWDYVSGSTSLDVTFKQSRRCTVQQSSLHSPPTQSLLWTCPLWDFFRRIFLLSLKQTKNHRGQFKTARITSEVLVPCRPPWKWTVMLSFFSCLQPCRSKMTHPFIQHSVDHELTHFETWQSPLHFYWTGNKTHILNSSPFLQPHWESFLLILSVSLLPLNTCGDA